jgi:hypothetical protein
MKPSLLRLSMRGAAAALILAFAQIAHARAYPKQQVPAADSA